MSAPSPTQLMRANQYLYYVTAEPIWSDYTYDMWCDKHGLEGGGGSDLASSYSAEEKALAEKMRDNPNHYRP